MQWIYEKSHKLKEQTLAWQLFSNIGTSLVYFCESYLLTQEIEHVKTPYGSERMTCEETARFFFQILHLLETDHQILRLKVR